jgi:4-oxalocrotonate tautomerase
MDVSGWWDAMLARRSSISTSERVRPGESTRGFFVPYSGTIDLERISTKGGEMMPLAQLKGLSGFLSADQKSELIRKVTDAIVSVEGEGLRPVTWVIIEEVPSGDWGVGGAAVTTEALKKLAAQGK